MNVGTVSATVLSLLLAAGGWPQDANGIEQSPQSAANPRVSRLFDAMRQSRLKHEQFPTLDWSDIPALLDCAGSTTTLKDFPRNPASSQFEPACSEGMVALWLIEGIRHSNKYASLNALCLKSATHGSDWTKQSEANHKMAAAAYRARWEKAKHLSVEQAKDLSPLEGTDLYWH